MNISRFSKLWLTLWKLVSTARSRPTKSPSSSRCCQLNQTCIAAESISWTTPAPQRLTVESVMNTWANGKLPSAAHTPPSEKELKEPPPKEALPTAPLQRLFEVKPEN